MIIDNLCLLLPTRTRPKFADKFTFAYYADNGILSRIGH